MAEDIESLVKEEYYKIIKAIWGNSMAVNPNDIDDSVIEAVNEVLTQIQICSSNLSLTKGLFKKLYSFGMNWKSVVIATIKGVKESEQHPETFEKSISEWLDYVKKSGKRYQTCITTAAAKHKSNVQLAIGGLLDF